MRRLASLAALLALAAGCGAGTQTNARTRPTKAVPRLNQGQYGSNAARQGAKACEDIPAGVIPDGADAAARKAALKAYVRKQLPNVAPDEALRGCLSAAGTS